MTGSSFNTNLEVGQIRKLLPYDPAGRPRLVVIAELDGLDRTCLVFLLNNFAEAATPRDVCFASEVIDSDFDVVVMTEFFSRADQELLEKGNVLGHISSEDLLIIRTISFSQPFGNIPSDICRPGMWIGTFPLQRYDSIWKFRANEFDNFSAITYVRNPISTAFSTRVLQHHEDIVDFLDECPLDVLFLFGREKVMVAA